MAKRYREFKRIKFTAVIGRAIQEKLVDKTFKHHFEEKKCSEDDTRYCIHEQSGSLKAARFVESAITVGKKRGHLDIPCPYAQSNPEAFVVFLVALAARVKGFAQVEKNSRTKGVMLRIAQEIEDYARRNAMEVLAETRIDC